MTLSSWRIPAKCSESCCIIIRGLKHNCLVTLLKRRLGNCSKVIVFLKGCKHPFLLDEFNCSWLHNERYIFQSCLLVHWDSEFEQLSVCALQRMPSGHLAANIRVCAHICLQLLDSYLKFYQNATFGHRHRLDSQGYSSRNLGLRNPLFFISLIYF